MKIDRTVSTNQRTITRLLVNLEIRVKIKSNLTQWFFLDKCLQRCIPHRTMQKPDQWIKNPSVAFFSHVFVFFLNKLLLRLFSQNYYFLLWEMDLVAVKNTFGVNDEQQHSEIDWFFFSAFRLRYVSVTRQQHTYKLSETLITVITRLFASIQRSMVTSMAIVNK